MGKETAIGAMLDDEKGLEDSTTTNGSRNQTLAEPPAAPPPVASTQPKPEFKEGGYGW
jgi:hypothetical protein